MSKVSIIMPSYKRQVSMISRSIGSVLTQSYKNIELVIVDDSPKDYEYREDVKAYIEGLDDPRITYIQNETNMGGALARNVGIFASSGDFISFLDDDDMYLPDKIKNQVDFMLKGDYDLSFTNLVLKNENEKVVDVREFHDIKSFQGDDFLKYHIMNHATGTPTFMYKASKLKELGGFDQAIMGQEFYLMLKSIEAGLKIGYLDTYDVVAFRHSGESISMGSNKIKGQKILHEKKKEYFHLFDNPEKRYINMRDRAVLAVAYYRNDMFGDALREALAAFASAPFQFTRAGFKFISGVMKF